eukprot:tig00001466_g8777.t1
MDWSKDKSERFTSKGSGHPGPGSYEVPRPFDKLAAEKRD